MSLHQPCSTSKFKYHHHHQYGLKLNGTHQLVVYADDVNISGGSEHTVKGNAEALVRRLDWKQMLIQLKYMGTSRDQNAG